MHPLVVHFAVVLLPLAGLALVAEVVVPKWADRFGVITVAGLAAGTAAAFVAKESGEALAAQVGEPATHAQWGDVLPVVSLALLVLAGAWLILHRRSRATGTRRSPVVTTLGVLAAVLALGVTGLTIAVGHSGAQAAWGDTIAGSTEQEPATASPSPAATPTAKGSSTPTAASSAAGYTLADVAKHGDQKSCWSVVDGTVYDLTDWINQHPGGAQRILGMCGKDASRAFNAQHGGQGRPERELATFKIGPLRT
jgi:uncharacterized membrane protein/predicted heme/steroid binding protein